MLPSVFGEKLFDDMFNDAFTLVPAFHKNPSVFSTGAKNLMKTDVRELENTYELDIDLPGFKKEEVNIELDKGYLTISASEIVDGRARNYYAVTAAGREYLRQTLAEYDEISGVFRQLMEGWDG